MIIKLTKQQVEIIAKESQYFLRLLIEKADEVEDIPYRRIINEVLGFLYRNQKVEAIKHLRKIYTSVELKNAFKGIYEFSDSGGRPYLKEAKEFVEWVQEHSPTLAGL